MGAATLAAITADARGYFKKISDILLAVRATDGASKELSLEDALQLSLKMIDETRSSARRVLLIGNGGSAAIASHLAVDFCKMSGVPAMAFNDPVHVTCFGNDYGFDNLFAESINMFGLAGDLLMAMSCSGRSPNVLNAVKAARAKGCSVITFGGFKPDAPLTAMGDLNFYVDSDQYGHVQIAHLALIHYMSDWFMEHPKN